MSRLTHITDALARWEAAQRTLGYRVGGVVGGLALSVGLAWLPTPEGLSRDAHLTGAVAVCMALWWVLAVLPMSVTALVPLVAFPMLGVATMGQAAAPYASHVLFLMLGGFLLGHGMETVGLHHRLTEVLLRSSWVRAKPARVLLALMVACAVLSGLVSNTATMVMLLPVAVALSQVAGVGGRGRAGFVLGLAYAASIGGTTTLVGTPPNAVLAGLVDISFGRWLTLGLPFALLALPVAWFIVSRWMLPEGGKAVEALEREAWRPGERSVLGIVALAMLLWLTRAPIDLGVVEIPGWSSLLPNPKGVKDAWVAIGAAMLLFTLPGGSSERPFLVTWREAEAAVPWGVIVLLGGGFSLAKTIERTGLTAYLAGPVAELGNLPPLAGIALLCLGMTFVTELTSNTATSQIVLPLLVAAAPVAGVDPLLWMVPATLSASCAFMMPIATAPNAIASEAGGVSGADMAVAGLFLNLACVVIAALVAWTLL
ncbi:MAG: SLC13/DASS family transporter [Proteobacteria bacterium]|nr:SLC13/DASS family transporter [Pseudomonadota bacterium]